MTTEYNNNCPLERAYHGNLELGFDEGGEEECLFEIKKHKTGWEYTGRYKKYFMLTEKGEKKLREGVKARARSVYEHMVPIFGSDNRVCWVSPSEHEAKILIRGSDMGEIALTYNTDSQAPVGDKKIQERKKTIRIKDKYCEFWIKSKEKDFTCSECRKRDNGCYAWEEIPGLSVDFNVGMMDQDRLEKVIGFLEDFIPLDLYQNNSRGFKRYIMSLSDDDNIERVLKKIVDAGIENRELEEWLSGKFPDLSEKSARRVVDK